MDGRQRGRGNKWMVDRGGGGNKWMGETEGEEVTNGW